MAKCRTEGYIFRVKGYNDHIMEFHVVYLCMKRIIQSCTKYLVVSGGAQFLNLYDSKLIVHLFLVISLLYFLRL